MESQVTDSQQELEADSFPSKGELVLGSLKGFDEQGRPLVSFQLQRLFNDVAAISTVELTPNHIGRQVGLLFTQTSDNTPVVVGVIHNPLQSILDNIEVVEANGDQTLFTSKSDRKPEKPILENDAVVDGQRVVIEGRDEVVLKCGESSITLNKNGKISIRGKYLLNRSTGVNRIMGGSVQVN